ncbi:hypothetical protein DERF_003086 [Dermatophagoides farinae]|uniref:Uncharacterized protein n=1 Tax=Dermatophagoides farinae TaxID=6954 RepID=A0A922IEX2_DERFA|nr:hypothetical protein DERF_003086 [Dermatophagoides farinae]
MDHRDIVDLVLVAVILNLFFVAAHILRFQNLAAHKEKALLCSVFVVNSFIPVQNRENDKSNLTRSVQNSKFKIKKITIKLKTTSSEFKIQNRENNKSNLTRSVQNSKSKKWQIQTNTTIKLNTTSSDDI